MRDNILLIVFIYIVHIIYTWNNPKLEKKSLFNQLRENRKDYLEKKIKKLEKEMLNIQADKIKIKNDNSISNITKKIKIAKLDYDYDNAKYDLEQTKSMLDY